MSVDIIKTVYIAPPIFVRFQDYMLNVSSIALVHLDIYTRKPEEIEYRASKYGTSRPKGGGVTYAVLMIKYLNGEGNSIYDGALNGIDGDDTSELQRDYAEFCEKLAKLQVAAS